MDKETKRRRIAREIENTLYDRELYPHMGLVPDYFLRYWELADAICDYFDIPFDKPELTPKE
tara:strand:- start:104 stop:289 length:186 start_codon:yes stop_codon:yes gene_type:complete